MGTWGTSITQNDTFLDVYSDFYEKWKSGTEVSNIIQELKREYLQEEDHEYWFALGKCLWEIGSLPEDVFERVKEIIISGDNLLLWEKSGAEESDLKARDKALKAFLKKLSIPNPKLEKPENQSSLRKFTGPCLREATVLPSI
ncbi:hypothetical protein [Pontibacter pamirensis]|uniref:hypothetical protein n=1 Tax=Pontibacter pamirensis TaxID=2562824 RepID=UPI0013897A48|nr:hypothetical protein [Pontibacter pamirensis]